MKRLPVRESCGFLAGILLHRSLGEEPCDLCAEAAKVKYQPLTVTPEQAVSNREVLEREVAAYDDKRRGNKHRKGDYQLPVTE